MNKIYETSKFTDLQIVTVDGKRGVSYLHETIFFVVPTNLEENLKKWCPKWAQEYEVAPCPCIQGTKVKLKFVTFDSDTVGKAVTGKYTDIHWVISSCEDGTTKVESAKFI